VTDLAHYRFRLRHDVTFAWRDNDPVVTSMNSTFYISEQMTGAPSEARLQALLADPYSPGPHFNDVVTGAILASRDSGQTPNRTDNAAWFANVPRGFYQ